MNKKEVAERLNISTRLVERYALLGRLGEKTYVRGKTGKQADWSEASVERLRIELETPSHPVTALQAANSPPTGLVAAEDRKRFIDALEALRDDRKNTRLSISDIAVKPLLTLAEAKSLTGLSRSILRAAIDEKKLKAKIIGRAWRVKRDDLDSYVKKL
jgi:excisionase family DNA binding protein